MEFEEDSLKYIEELIRNNNVNAPKDLEKKIIDKYSKNIDYNSQAKMK